MNDHFISQPSSVSSERSVEPGNVGSMRLSEEVSLYDLLDFFMRHLKLWLAIVVVFCVIGMGYVLFYGSRYTSNYYLRVPSYRVKGTTTLIEPMGYIKQWLSGFRAQHKLDQFQVQTDISADIIHLQRKQRDLAPITSASAKVLLREFNAVLNDAITHKRESILVAIKAQSQQVQYFKSLLEKQAGVSAGVGIGAALQIASEALLRERQVVDSIMGFQWAGHNIIPDKMSVWTKCFIVLLMSMFLAIILVFLIQFFEGYRRYKCEGAA